ncbi:unnamed protein product, partial [Adineta steineri]
MIIIKVIPLDAAGKTASNQHICKRP